MRIVPEGLHFEYMVLPQLALFFKRLWALWGMGPNWQIFWLGFESYGTILLTVVDMAS